MNLLILTFILTAILMIVVLEEKQPKGVAIVCKRYYQNDTLKEEIPYNRRHQIHGIYRQWYKNGNLQMKAIFKNGDLNGLCQKFDVHGRLVKKIVFKNGDIVKEQNLTAMADE